MEPCFSDLICFGRPFEKLFEMGDVQEPRFDCISMKGLLDGRLVLFDN